MRFGIADKADFLQVSPLPGVWSMQPVIADDTYISLDLSSPYEQ